MVGASGQHHLGGYRLLISAQDWARTATGATVILVAFSWFLISSGVCLFRGEHDVR